MNDLMQKLRPWMRVTFNGRLNRWRYFVFGIGMSFVFWIPMIIIVLLENVFESSDIILTILGIIYFIIALYPSIYSFSLSVRRLHDLEKSGWLVLIFLIPIVNFFFALYLLFAKGTEGPNKYGDEPLAYEDYDEYVETVN